MLVISSIFLLTLLSQADATTRGVDAFRQGRFAEAEATLVQSLSAHPDDLTAKAFLAMTKAAKRDCQPAIEFVSSSKDETLTRLSGLAAVECLAATNKSEDSFDELSKVMKRFPGDPDVLYESAKLHRKAWDSAIAELYSKAPSSYRVNQLSAEVFETQGNYGEAVAQYSKAIGKAPEALNLHFRRGRCLLLESPSQENLSAARTDFEQELKLNPTDAVAEYEIGQTLSVSEKSEEAAAHYQHASELSPSFAEAYIATGKIRAQQKEYVAAVELFLKAVTVQPDNEAAHYNLMLAYRNLGKSEDAMQQKKELDRLQKTPDGEFAGFLKKLGEKEPKQ